MKYLTYLFIFILVFTSFTNAAEFRANESVYVDEGDTMQTDLFVGARNVEVEGVIMGDVFAGCRELHIAGEVEDDVIAGCQNLQVRNKVGDQVIGFAEKITIDGEVGGDVLAFSGEVRITKNAHIKGDLYVGTGNLIFEGGQIDGKIKGGAKEATLNGHVAGLVDLELHDVVFGKNYKADQGTTLKLYKPLDEDKENLPENLEIVIEKKKYFFHSLFFFWSMIAMFIVGLLIVIIFKKFPRDILRFAKKDQLKNIGSGFLMLVATPIVVVILAVLIITIPVSLIILAVYLILLYLSSIIAGLFIGDYMIGILKKDGNSTNLILALLLGVIAIALISKIPLIGWLFSLLFICFGLGTFVLYILQLIKKRQQTA